VRRIYLLISCYQLTLLLSTSPVRAVPADDPPAFIPLGAYVSWERIYANAEHYGIDPWVDAGRRLDVLKANHVNLLWVTNMSQRDLPRLIRECETRNIKLLPSMGEVEAKIDERWANDGAYYSTVLPTLLKVAGKSDTLVGWVLSDEPTEQSFSRLETLRQRFLALDPGRFCTAVTMWGDTPKLPGQTKLPVVCVDLYPFFGPDDPNGPHTDATSKEFVCRNAAAMIKAIGDRHAVGWVMGMCFSEIWGPRKYDRRGHLIGLPGSYLHWRCPTLAEMRWQVWETFRSGAKGFVCYTTAPEAPKDKMDPVPSDDGVKLAKTATDMGPNALTNPDGSVTPQLQELGRVYSRLTTHVALIRRWRLSDEPAIKAGSGSSVQVFVDPATGGKFALLVNDDLHQEQTIVLQRGASATLIDLIRGAKLALERDNTGAAVAKIRLAAGDGTILRIENGLQR